MWRLPNPQYFLAPSLDGSSLGSLGFFWTHVGHWNAQSIWVLVGLHFESWILLWESTRKKLNVTTLKSICGSGPILTCIHSSWLKASQNCRHRLILCSHDRPMTVSVTESRETEPGKRSRMGKDPESWDLWWCRGSPIHWSVPQWLTVVGAVRQSYICSVLLTFLSSFLPICCHKQLDILATSSSKPRLTTKALRRPVKITNQPMSNSSNAGIILIYFMICCLVLSWVYLLIRKSIFLYSFFSFCVKWLCFLLFNLHKIKGFYLPSTSRKRSF